MSFITKFKTKKIDKQLKTLILSKVLHTGFSPVSPISPLFLLPRLPPHTMFWTSFKGNSSIHRLQSYKPCLSYYKTTPVLGLNIIHVPLNSKSKMYYVWVSFLQIGQTSCIWYEFALVFLRPFVSLPDHVRSSLIEPECQWHRFFTIIKHHETVL